MRALPRTCLFVAALGMATGPAAAATITIVNSDGPGEGFNDATPATPVGGNTGTTIGAQRLYVFQYAANIWGGILPSNVQIRVRATFDPLTCGPNYAILGSAGPVSMWRDFPGAPVAGHWYHVSLANKLANLDLSSGDDIVAQFNSGLGGTNCLPSGWYYGVDGTEGNKIELLPVVLHELGHGLGFSTSTNGSTGSYMGSHPSIYDRFLRDAATGLHWDQMTASQRAASAVACQGLAWDGPSVTRRANAQLGDKSVLRVTAPSSLAGDLGVGPASFGPPLSDAGVSGRVVLVNDGTGAITNGCETIQNASALRGNIALVDRGLCTFPLKVKNAQNAGAIAVIVADSLPGCPAASMSGTDHTITIPSVRVTQADGNALKAALAGGLFVTLRRDSTLGAGTDASGRVLLYTPSSFAGGSSVSHWDTSAYPDLLMEPSLNPSLSSGVDLTRWAFSDLGWFPDSADATSPNLVTNSSFESSTSGWGVYAGSTISRVGGGHGGSHSLAVRGPATTSTFGVNDAPDWVSPVAAVGTRYRYSAWVRSDSSAGNAQLQIREFLSGVQKGATVRSTAVRLSPTWQVITADYIATTTGSSLNFQIIDSPAVSGEVFQVDDVWISIVPGIAVPNLVTNPSFESSTAGWGTFAGSTISRVIGGHDGAYSLAVRGPATTSMFGVNDAPDWISPVAAVGTRYRFAAWVRSDSSVGNAQIQIREFLSGVQKGSTVRSTAVRLSPTWQAITADYVATTPGSSLNLQIIDTPLASGEVFQVDDVGISIVPGTAPPEAALSAIALPPLQAFVSPNPIATTGSLSLITTRPGFVRAELFDVRGRLVRGLANESRQPAGRHTYALDGFDGHGTRLAVGMYYYRVSTLEGTITGRFVVLR